MDYHYFYLLLALVWLAVWTALFLLRKDTRKEMLIMGILFGIGGVISEFSYIKDWWQPWTITRTGVGIEDFLFGFSFAGIASALYGEIYHKRLRRFAAHENSSFIFWLFLVLFFGPLSLFGINTFYASLIAFGAGAIIMLLKRHDLVGDSLISGACLMVISVLIYHLLKPVFPDFVEKFWVVKDGWFDLVFLGVPIKEYLWFFVAGMFIAPLYPFWKHKKWS